MLVQIPLLLLAVAVGIQLMYLLFVFSRTAFYSPPENIETPTQGVSVIVSAWNEADNLKELLPLLDAQQYTDFEVIVINDRSTDDTFDYLLTGIGHLPHVRYIHVEKTPAHITAKKYALTLGIKSAKNDIILLTDADCRPVSEYWIAGMSAQMTSDKSIVLGLSPYYQLPGFLNAVIRYETFYTALQYISFALAKLPYMGIGRNLMYRKSLFLENKGFNKHNHVIGGDDDLLMNDIATSRNTAICLHPNTLMYSMPKTTWSDWYTQKRRHLSVGKFYRFRNRFMLGLLGLSQVASWILFFILVGLALFQKNTQLLAWASGILGFRWLLQWLIFGKANGRLGGMTHAGLVPLYDLLWFFYHLILGSITLISRKKMVTWR